MLHITFYAGINTTPNKGVAAVLEGSKHETTVTTPPTHPGTSSCVINKAKSTLTNTTHAKEDKPRYIPKPELHAVTHVTRTLWLHVISVD